MIKETIMIKCEKHGKVCGKDNTFICEKYCEEDGHEVHKSECKYMESG